MEKPMGPDEMHPQVMRQIAQCTAVPLNTIFNMSLGQSVLPTDFDS